MPREITVGSWTPEKSLVPALDRKVGQGAMTPTKLAVVFLLGQPLIAHHYSDVSGPVTVNVRRSTTPSPKIMSSADSSALKGQGYDFRKRSYRAAALGSLGYLAKRQQKQDVCATLYDSPGVPDFSGSLCTPMLSPTHRGKGRYYRQQPGVTTPRNASCEGLRGIRSIGCA